MKKIHSSCSKIIIIFVSFLLCASIQAKQSKALLTDSASQASEPKASLPQAIIPGIPAAPTVDAKGYILMDTNTGMILAGKNIDSPMPPASLTKLMTLYQIADALKSGRLHMEDPVPVSEKAWRTGGSKMFIR